MKSFFQTIQQTFTGWFNNSGAAEVSNQLPAATVNALPHREAASTRSGTRHVPRDGRTDLGKHCYKVGNRTALSSGLPVKDAEMVRTLDAEAQSIAQAGHRPPSQILDQQRVARLTLLDETRPRQIVERDRAAIQLGATKEKLAAMGTPAPFPTLSSVLEYSALIGLSISIAPTFHDMCVGLDPFLRWAVGGGCAVGVSLLIIHGILPGNRGSGAADVGGKSKKQNAAATGYLMGGALAVIRLAGARTVQDLLLTSALTAAEFSVVWLLERKAKALEAEISEFLTEEKLRGKEDREVQRCAEELDRRQALLDATVDEINTIQIDLEYDHLMSDLKTLNQIAGNSIRAGYQAGISQNAGELGGVKFNEVRYE